MLAIDRSAEGQFRRMHRARFSWPTPAQLIRSGNCRG
jgi:hypothetical protein